MAGIALAVAAVAVVVLAVLIVKGRRDSPEVQEWKGRAAAATKADFRFEIDEAFAIRRDDGPVLAITGQVKRGKAEVGDKVVIETSGGPVETRLVAIEMFDKELAVANPGDMIALVVRGVEKASIRKGQTVIMAR